MVISLLDLRSPFHAPDTEKVIAEITTIIMNINTSELISNFKWKLEEVTSIATGTKRLLRHH